MWDNHGGTFLYFAARHDGSLVEPGYWTCSLLVYCASSKFYLTYRVLLRIGGLGWPLKMRGVW